jgi:threonine dehydrogenase-like Zn-dependent dehydrogenase
LAHFDDRSPRKLVGREKKQQYFTVRGEGGLSVPRAMSLMAEGKINAKPLITHSFPLSQLHAP